MKNMKNLFKKTVAAMLVTMMVMGLAACGKNADDGKMSITVEVKDANGEVSTYTGKTDAENLYDAIVNDIGGVTLDGYDSDYGFYITTVNGITADYDTDGAYWSIYVNGEYGQYGVDSQPVADGDTYTLAYEVYVAE